jgi:hypothetical protein
MTGHNRTTKKVGHPNHMVVPICVDCHQPIYAYRARDQKRCRPCWTKYDREWDKAYYRRVRSKQRQVVKFE